MVLSPTQTSYTISDDWNLLALSWTRNLYAWIDQNIKISLGKISFLFLLAFLLRDPKHSNKHSKSSKKNKGPLNSTDNMQDWAKFWWRGEPTLGAVADKLCCALWLHSSTRPGQLMSCQGGILHWWRCTDVASLGTDLSVTSLCCFCPPISIFCRYAASPFPSAAGRCCSCGRKLGSVNTADKYTGS